MWKPTVLCGVVLPCSTSFVNIENPDIYWLVLSTPLKNISQLGWLFPIYGKIKNVPNHQPVYYSDSFTKYSDPSRKKTPCHPEDAVDEIYQIQIQGWKNVSNFSILGLLELARESFPSFFLFWGCHKLRIIECRKGPAQSFPLQAPTAWVTLKGVTCIQEPVFSASWGWKMLKTMESTRGNYSFFEVWNNYWN